MASFLLSLTLCLYTASAEIIDTSISYQYQNQHINCSNNGNCTILCDESYSCDGSTIFCPINTVCHISCTQQYSCRDITIKWPSNNAYSLSCNNGVLPSGMGACQGIIYKPYHHNQQFLFHCIGDSICRNSHIICPTNADCNILCDGSFACYNAIFLCPNNNGYQCNITCKGYYSCYFTRFEGNGIVSSCDGEASCSWMVFPYPLQNTTFNLQCDHPFSCSSAKIYCPLNAECHIQCNADNSCSDTFIKWPKTTSINATLSCNKSVTACTGLILPPPMTDITTANANEDFVVNCGTDIDCTGNIIHCPTNGSCNVNCVGEKSCTGTMFNWIENQPHSVLCQTGDYVCYGIELYASNPHSDYHFDCTNVPYWHSCQRTTIRCPKNASCTIICGSSQACAQAIIHGPINHKLTIICTGGMYGCDDVTVHAKNASDVFIECSQWESCTNMILWIPTNDNYDIASTIINGASKDGIRNSIIYAVNGWRDVRFTDFESDEFGKIEHKGKMICTSNYNSWCNWDLYEWKCASSGDTTCGGEEILWPSTANPTHSPSIQTQHPSAKPTEIPSSHPSFNPTFHPTIYPTMEPSIHPTVDPTIDPTLDPTNDPTTDPTIYPTVGPTVYPTFNPSSNPTEPTTEPTSYPTQFTNNPTIYPSIDPTADPTTDPTINPSSDPTDNPTNHPSNNPTIYPTIYPSMYPTIDPTAEPTTDPTVNTSSHPTTNPTSDLTVYSTINPSSDPTDNPPTHPSINSTIYILIDPIIGSPTIHPTNTLKNDKEIYFESSSLPITEIVVVMIVIVIIIIVIVAIIIYIGCHCKGYSKVNTNDTEEIEIQKHCKKMDIITTDIDDKVLEHMRDILDEDLNQNEQNHRQSVTKTLIYEQKEEEEGSQQVLCHEMDECLQIANMLKKCAGTRYEKYLENFKSNLITDKNIKFIDITDKEEWKQIIPETGIRCHFLAILKKQNK